MAVRRILPNLLMNAAVPLSINILARPYMSTIDALLLASSVPALYTLGSLLVKRRIDVLGLLVVAGLLLSAVFALLFNSPRLLLLQSSAVNGLFGVVILLSLLFTRPVLFYLVRSITTQNDKNGPLQGLLTDVRFDKLSSALTNFFAPQGDGKVTLGRRLAERTRTTS